MEANIVAAWWGATVATIVMVWEIYKWRFVGARLRLEARIDVAPPNLNIVTSEGNLFVLLAVSNYGDRPTTVIDFEAYLYPSRFHSIIRKGKQVIPVPCTYYSHEPPFVIESGQQWIAGIDHVAQLQSMRSEGAVLFQVRHSASKHPCKVRL